MNPVRILAPSSFLLLTEIGGRSRSDAVRGHCCPRFAFDVSEQPVLRC
jgi:hypothetical protein